MSELLVKFKEELKIEDIDLAICNRTHDVLITGAMTYRINEHLWRECWEDDPCSWKAQGLGWRDAMLMLAGGKPVDRIPPYEKMILSKTGTYVVHMIKDYFLLGAGG